MGMAMTGMSGMSALFGGGLAPPPLSANYLTYYEGSLGVLDGSGNPQTTAFGVVGTWQDQSANAYHLTQSNNALRPFYRTSSTPGLKVVPGVYPFTDNARYLSQATCPLNKRDTSFFAIVDTNYQVAFSVGESRVIWQMAGAVGSLQYDLAAVSFGRIQWVDGGGTHDTGLRLSAGWNLVGVVLSASAITIWVNDQSVTYTALAAGTATGFTVFNTNAGAVDWQGSAQAIVLYNKAISAGEKLLVDAWAVSRGVNYTTATSPIYIAAGDSISSGLSAEDWQGYGWQGNYGNAIYYNCGFAGKQWTDAHDPLNLNGVNLYDITKLCVCHYNLGTNDIFLGNSAATVFANRSTVLARLRAAGMMVIEHLIIPSKGTFDAGHEAERLAYNALLLAETDRVHSNYKIAIPANLADYTNLTYYTSDGVHPWRLGHAQFVPEFQTPLTTLLALQSQVTTKQAEWYFNGNYQDSTIYTRDLTVIGGSPSFSAGLGGQQRLTLVKASSQYAAHAVSSAGANPGVFDWYPMTISFELTTTETAGGTIVANNDNAGVGFNCYLDTGGKLHFDLLRQAAAGSVSSGATTFAVNDGSTRAVAIVIDSAGVRIYVSPTSNFALLGLEKSVAWTGTPGKFVPSSKAVRLGVNHDSTVFTGFSIQALRFHAEARTLPQLQALQAIAGTAVPEAPAALATGLYTTGSMPVTCVPPLSNGSEVTLYEWYIALHSGGGHEDIYTLAGTSTTPNFTYTVTDESLYHIKCRTINGVGASAYSNIVTFTATTVAAPAGATVIFDAWVGAYSDGGATLCTNGDSLQQLTNQAGSNYGSQPTSNLRGVFKNYRLNGRPGIQFTGGQFLKFLNSINTWPCTIAIAGYWRDNSPANGRMFGMGQEQGIYNGGTNWGAYKIFGGATQDLGVASTVPKIAVIRMDNTAAWKPCFNGVLSGATLRYAGTPAENLAIGAHGDTGLEYANVEWFRFKLWPSVLSDGDTLLASEEMNSLLAIY